VTWPYREAGCAGSCRGSRRTDRAAPVTSASPTVSQQGSAPSTAPRSRMHAGDPQVTAFPDGPGAARRTPGCAHQGHPSRSARSSLLTLPGQIVWVTCGWALKTSAKISTYALGGRVESHMITVHGRGRSPSHPGVAPHRARSMSARPRSWAARPARAPRQPSPRTRRTATLRGAARSPCTRLAPEAGLAGTVAAVGAGGARRVARRLDTAATGGFGDTAGWASALTTTSRRCRSTSRGGSGWGQTWSWWCGVLRRDRLGRRHRR